MQYIGWLLSGLSDQDKLDILPQLIPIACECFNLCASVGCGCLTDSPDTITHNETTFGTKYPIHFSEGPTWSACAYALDSSIRLDIHYNSPIVGSEGLAIRRRLVTFNRPLFNFQGSGAQGL